MSIVAGDPGRPPGRGRAGRRTRVRRRPRHPAARARRALGLAALMFGVALAWWPARGDAGDTPWRTVAPLAVAGLLIVAAVDPRERARAGCGFLMGRTLSATGLALAVLAPWAWDRAAFAFGLLALGLWIAQGAAPPREAPRPWPAGRGGVTGASVRAARRNAP